MCVLLEGLFDYLTAHSIFDLNGSVVLTLDKTRGTILRATTVWDASMSYSWTYPKPCSSIGNKMLSISTHLSKHTAVAVSAENVTRIIRDLLFAKKKYLERLIN